MNIGIDIDDTISNTYEYLFPYAQKYTIQELGKEIKNVNRNAITHMYTTTFHNWNEEEERNFFKKYYEKILKEVQPRKYAAEVIKQWKKQGHKIYLITARFRFDTFNVEEETKKWLEENGIVYDELIINAEDKVKVAQNKKINVFIDDSIKNCRDMAESGIRTFIMDTIINFKFEDEKITRVYSWPHLYQQITKMIM